MKGVGDWDGTLSEAEKKLREAARRVMEADGGADRTAQAEFDGWSRLIISHPEYVEREREAAAQWENQHLQACTAALADLRTVIPPTIQNLSRRELTEAVGSNALGRRCFEKRILCFLWMQPDAIGALHFAELDSKYWGYGLDLRESQAV